MRPKEQKPDPALNAMPWRVPVDGRPGIAEPARFRPAES